MKKLIKLIVLLFLVIIPVRIEARDGITNYYIYATILSNGDINVREIFTMNGSFNGMNRIINFEGSYDKFDGSIDSFKGSDIYNGDSIIINEVKGISYSNKLVFSDLGKMGDRFKEVSTANKGDYGVYTNREEFDGINLMIYNPSSRNKAFYIDYTITNMAIIHNDVAELGFNLFTELTEYVDNLEMVVSVPNNQNTIKVWAHGPLWGESRIVNKKTVKITVTELEPNTPVDIRLVFDKEVLSESSKYSNTDALDKIIKLETEQALIANQERDEIKASLERKENIGIFLDVLKGLWLIGLVIIFCFIYSKYDKEYRSSFKTKYFRDFPSSNPPTTVGYLIRKKINNDDLSASILMLIYNKILSFEPINNKKDDYILTYHQKEDISIIDKKLLEFLFMKNFNEINESEQVILSVLKKQASKKYEKFLKLYTEFKNTCMNEAKSKNFYESNSKPKILSSIYAFIGLLVGFYSIDYLFTNFSNIFNLIFLIIMIIALIYFIAFTKRTKDGNEEYQKWLGLKNFMEDFGTMDKKDLPEIVLWEKYLVYAVTLGCADKLAETMKIKATEFEELNSNDIIFDYYRFQHLTSFNRTISRTVNTAFNSATQARNIANSNYSSGSGSGGGFSGGFGGGGSFGGGGGGGRF